MLSVDQLDLIESESRRLIDAARRDPGRGVPQYPGWSLSDLASHLASIHGRTTLVCAQLPKERISAPRLPEGADPVAWCEEMMEEMMEALRGTPPDLEVWAFGPEKTIGFWQRRMLNETGIHRWDAEQAFGIPGGLVDDVVICGLDEFDGMYVHQLGDVPTICLVATDLDRSWTYGVGEPTLTVEATGSDLYLRLMSRPSSAQLPSSWARAVDALEPPPKR